MQLQHRLYLYQVKLTAKTVERPNIQLWNTGFYTEENSGRDSITSSEQEYRRHLWANAYIVNDVSPENDLRMLEITRKIKLKKARPDSFDSSLNTSRRSSLAASLVLDRSFVSHSSRGSLRSISSQQISMSRSSSVERINLMPKIESIVTIKIDDSTVCTIQLDQNKNPILAHNQNIIPVMCDLKPLDHLFICTNVLPSIQGFELWSSLLAEHNVLISRKAEKQDGVKIIKAPAKHADDKRKIYALESHRHSSEFTAGSRLLLLPVTVGNFQLLLPMELYEHSAYQILYSNRDKFNIFWQQVGRITVNVATELASKGEERAKLARP